jgi:hypothetical protein
MGMILAAVLALQAPANVSDLAWLSGRWETAAEGRWTEESWSVPRGGMLLGYSRSGQGETVREFEHLRIQAGTDGVPVYWASPGGRAVVGFRLVSASGTEVVFENPQHDFPQRIRYRRDGDALVATISAIDGSNAKSWTYRRQ